jgi:O-antigen/teichoic acid export membrane protein
MGQPSREYHAPSVAFRLQSWAGSAGWAVLDYALFALAGMLANVLLARGLSAQSYGAYAVSFAVYMVVFVVHSALFAEPMLVLAAQRFREQTAGYLRVLLRAHALFSLALVALAGMCALVPFGDPRVRHALWCMALAAPFMNLVQLLRRVCYGLWSTRSAALGAGAYLLLLMAALAALHTRGRLSLGSGYAALGGVSALVSLGFWLRLGRSADSAQAPALGAVVRAHLGFARYGIGTALLGWVPQNAWYLVLPLVLPGPAQLGPSGHLRALVNLVQPMLQVNGALGTLLVPTFARQPNSTPWRFTGFMTAVSALYAPALVLLGPLANRVLYRGAYPSSAAALWILGAAPACFAFYTSLRSYCVARERPNLPLWATAFASVVSLSIGVWLCAWSPLTGSALAMLGGFALQGLCLSWLLQRRSAESARPSSERAA